MDILVDGNKDITANIEPIFSFELDTRLPNTYTVSFSNRDENNNLYVFTESPSTTFVVNRLATVFIAPSSKGNGNGVDEDNATTWDNVADIITDDGTVYFTDGTYLLSGKTISKPWTLTASSASNVIVNSSSSSYIFTSTVDNVHIKNLTLYSTGYPISAGSNVINVENSVIYNQIEHNLDSSYVYGSTISLDCTFIKVAPSTLTAYVNGDELGTSTVSGSTYTITKNGNLAVGSYTLSATKKQEKRRII